MSFIQDMYTAAIEDKRKPDPITLDQLTENTAKELLDESAWSTAIGHLSKYKGANRAGIRVSRPGNHHITCSTLHEAYKIISTEVAAVAPELVVSVMLRTDYQSGAQQIDFVADYFVEGKSRFNRLGDLSEFVRRHAGSRRTIYDTYEYEQRVYKDYINKLRAESISTRRLPFATYLEQRISEE